MKSLCSSLALALSLLGFAACVDEPAGHHVTPPECNAIANACHATSSTAGQDCHLSSEAVWTAAECTAMAASCLALCNAETDAGVGVADAAATDAAATDAN